MEIKSFKIVQAKFRKKFNFNNYPQKSQIYRLVHKSQATGSGNNLNKKAKTPRSVQKLTSRCYDNLDAVNNKCRKT